MSSDCDQPSVPVPTNHEADLPPKNPPGKRRKKYSKEKLPTPPPDPNIQSETQNGEERYTDNRNKENEVEVFDYIESLQRVYSRSSSTFAPVIVTEEAFDHLDKLYKLMEQMLDLREQNAKLQRRIRDLEHVNNLEKLHQQFDLYNLAEAYPDLEKDTAFAESILESILQDTAAKNKELQKQSRGLKPSILRRGRSNSATDKQVTLEGPEPMTDREEQGRNKSAKISKWTKVKAAFRWEKASTSVGDSTKSQDSGIHVSGVQVPINYEVARYLRVPSTSDDAGHSQGDSGAGVSTPGSISSASSTDDFHRGRLCDDRSSDDENSNYIPHKSRGHHSRHLHHHRTPWAKMKDIINTRNSFKKKHRLSAASDDIQIDVELCSDSEDVFLDDTTPSKSAQMSLSPSPNILSCSSTSPSEVPPEIVERYQKILTEDSASDSEAKTPGQRWSRVRRAFLDDNDPHSSKPARLPLKTRSNSIEEEIQRNYRNLQKKLSLEFQEKLCEWDRMKQNSPGISTSPSCSYNYNDEPKDLSFMKKMEEWEKIKKQHSPTNHQRAIPMTREYQLPPEFKKKLQEWEKIKKNTTGGSKKKLSEVGKWKSLGGHSRPDHSPVFEYPVLTEEFRKKLEEWKKIKASGGPQHLDYKKGKDKTPSPSTANSRRNSSPRHSKTRKDSPKEFHWFEKEMGKIERHKQRLEREKQKFEEREERLSILRRAMLGHTTKKEVLVHTPTGFHRFEGISRKFTQKLYEWEKSQGIAPECSTFALLSNKSPIKLEDRISAEHPNITSFKTRHSAGNTPPLQRSRSADSITMSAMNLTCPLMSTQPSSLSLNDMEELEKELVTSKTSSMDGMEEFLMDSANNLDYIDEPEAVLVEVEDYEEETAEPLRTFVQHEQLPVYQREGVKFLCEGETIAAPKVRRSESARAQASYDLIENVMKLLTELNDNEESIDRIDDEEVFDEENSKTKFKVLNDVQIELVNKIIKTLTKLQEENTLVIKTVTEEKDVQRKRSENVVAVQDISTELIQNANHINQIISKRTPRNEYFATETIFSKIQEVRLKISDLRKHLSYICSAKDSTDTKSKKKTLMKSKVEVHKTVSNESKDSKESSTEGSKKNSKKEKKFIKWDNGSNSNSQCAIKKRIRYRQKTQKSNPDSDEDNEDTDSSKTSSNIRQHKKVTRTRSISDSNMPKLDPNLLMPTTPHFDSTTSDSRIDSSPSDSAVTLFVKTTRKLFVPIVEGNLNKSSATTSSDLSEPKSPETVSSLPPLPGSPIPQRKVYVSPGIRMMISKYNQKISENDIKSGGSSGSNSPVAWRSPVLERRVKAQTEKYQEGIINKQTSLNLIGRDFFSSSADAILSSNKQVTFPFPKSSSKEPIKIQSSLKQDLTLDIDLANRARDKQNVALPSPEVRMRKIQKAKEEFLKSEPKSAPPNFNEQSVAYPERNRLSQISVGSESSSSFYGGLVKSVSAGMINIETEAYKRVDPEYHWEGYVSLPRNSRKKKQGKSAFASIASKFRKVKMRRGKEKSKHREKDKEPPKENVENHKETLETLCRQSLLVDIQNDVTAGCSSSSSNNNNVGEVNETREEAGSSVTPVSKSSSWIKRNIFKK